MKTQMVRPAQSEISGPKGSPRLARGKWRQRVDGTSPLETGCIAISEAPTGRALSRGEALKSHDAEFQAFLKKFRVVTPVDFRRVDVRMRRDIMSKKLEDIRMEAPFAYKETGPVVKTLEMEGIAHPVAELHPLLTVKG